MNCRAYFLIGCLACTQIGCSSSSSSSSPGDAGGDTGVDAGGCSTSVQATAGTVITDKGAVVGEQVGTTWRYRGIPYAAAPTGSLRWKAPAPHACWSDALSAKSFGAVCPQPDLYHPGTIIGNEDCLTANVWVPQGGSAGAPLPVMVYVHGGGNNAGGSGEPDAAGTSPQWDGQALAEKGGVIVVTFNYRLGVLGYMVHPELASENAHSVSGNYGLLDQIAALQWVQTNIAGFGGDPKQVTVFGESAGAIDECLLLTSPLAAGLFQKMIMESFICTAVTVDDEKSLSAQAITASGCPADTGAVSCMRGLTAEQIVKAFPGPTDLGKTLTGKYPVTMQGSQDGYVVPDQPLKTIVAGKHNHAALIVGSNEGETKSFVRADLTDAEYRSICTDIVGGDPANGDLLYSQYPTTEYGTPAKALGALTTDLIFTCSERRTAKRATEHQKEPVYRYYYTHVYEGAAPYPASVPPGTTAAGAYHTSELPFVFGHLTLNGYAPTDAEKALSDTMMGYWTRFAKTGDPNGSGAVQWSVYDPSVDDYLVLDDAVTTGTKLRASQCDFWDAFF